MKEGVKDIRDIRKKLLWDIEESIVRTSVDMVKGTYVLMVQIY
jgi:hypothetical protein